MFALFTLRRPFSYFSPTLAGILATASAFALSGCGGGGAFSSTNLISRLAGTTWKAVAVTSASGQTVVCPGTLTLAPGADFTCGANDTVSFAADGSKLKITASDGTADGTATFTATVSGNTMTTSTPASGSDAAYSTTLLVSIVGSTMTVKQISSTSPDPTVGSDFDNSVQTFTRQ